MADDYVNPLLAIFAAAEGFPHASCPDGAHDCNQARAIVDAMFNGVRMHADWDDMPGMLGRLGFARQRASGHWGINMHADAGTPYALWMPNCGNDNHATIMVSNGTSEAILRNPTPWDIITLCMVYGVPLAGFPNRKESTYVPPAATSRATADPA